MSKMDRAKRSIRLTVNTSFGRRLAIALRSSALSIVVPVDRLSRKRFYSPPSSIPAFERQDFDRSLTASRIRSAVQVAGKVGFSRRWFLQAYVLVSSNRRDFHDPHEVP